MTKKDTHAKHAEELYVIQQMTLKDIALRLSLSYKTVYNWSREFEWETKRSSVTSSGKLHTDLIETAKVLLRKMQVDIEQGTEVDMERFYALSRLIESAQRSLKYEQQAPEKTKTDLSPEEKSKQLASKIREILGL